MLKRVDFLVLGAMFVATVIQWQMYINSNGEYWTSHSGTSILQWFIVCMGTGVIIWFASISKTTKGKLYFMSLAAGYPIITTTDIWAPVLASEVSLLLVETITYSLFFLILACLQIIKVRPDISDNET